MPDAKRILLIIGGGIAAYKSLDQIRRLNERGFRVRCILTRAAQEFITALAALLGPGGGGKPLAGKRVVVTSGPTHEPIDPVRYITDRSSGRQGHAIATAARAAGADVVLISGPVSVADPPGVTTIKVE